MMRSKIIFLALLMGSTMVLFSQTKGFVPQSFDNREDTEHFVLVWNNEETKVDEITEAKKLAEETFRRLNDILGEENMPEDKLIVIFGGEGMDPKTRAKKTPHVDLQGRINLFRFDPEGYLGAFPHELVHAIRINEIPRWEPFFEEGLASSLAYFLNPKISKFPRFGYPLNLVAGYWLTSGSYIPLSTMRSKHRTLNLKCQIQTYILREDFFNYLNTKYGLKKLVSFAHSQKVGALEEYQKTWGKSFEELTKEWEVDLKQRFKSIEDSKEQIDSYFKNTSAQYFPVCMAGIDY